MPVNAYECLFLLDTTKVAGDVENARNTVQNLLTKHGCEILASRPWDERRLAYPINGQKKGLYWLTYFKADASKIQGIQDDSKLIEMILRELILVIPPKLVDRMLEVGHDEHRLALHTMTEEGEAGPTGPGGTPAEGGEGGGEEGAGGPPRRGGFRRGAPAGAGAEGKE